jgi:hypothetical protein
MGVSNETRLFRPIPQPSKVGPELLSAGREPVAGTSCMLYQRSCPKLAQPLRKHARRHLRNPRRKLAIGQRIVIHLPQQPHSPAPTQHVKQLIASVP